MTRILTALALLGALGCAPLTLRDRDCVYARQQRYIRRDTSEFFVMPASAGTVVRMHGDTVDLWALTCRKVAS